jgi:hypothetical protein
VLKETVATAPRGVHRPALTVSLRYGAVLQFENPLVRFRGRGPDLLIGGPLESILRGGRGRAFWFS